MCLLAKGGLTPCAPTLSFPLPSLLSLARPLSLLPPSLTEQLRQQQRAMRRTNRELERDRGGLERQEKQIVRGGGGEIGRKRGRYLDVFERELGRL